MWRAVAGRLAVILLSTLCLVGLAEEHWCRIWKVEDVSGISIFQTRHLASPVLRPEARIDLGFDLDQRPLGRDRRAAEVGAGGNVKLGLVGMGGHLVLPAVGEAFALDAGRAAEGGGLEIQA